MCFALAGVLREVTTHFTVDAWAHYKSGGSHIKVGISNPSGANTDAYITDKGDGTYRVEYMPFEDGEALVEVLWCLVEWTGRTTAVLWISFSAETLPYLSTRLSGLHNAAVVLQPQ